MPRFGEKVSRVQEQKWRFASEIPRFFSDVFVPEAKGVKEFDSQDMAAKYFKGLVVNTKCPFPQVSCL